MVKPACSVGLHSTSLRGWYPTPLRYGDGTPKTGAIKGLKNQAEIYFNADTWTE
jgi:hypothetical protein